MFPLFHIFIPLILLEGLLYVKLRINWKFKRILIIIGSILPDLLDKPLTLLFPTIFNGRGVFHAPMTNIILLICVSVICKDKSISYSLGYGIFLHLLLDIPDIPWFWPIIPMDFYDSSLSNWFLTLTTNPLVFGTEITAFVGIVGLFLYHQVITRKNIIDITQLHHFLFDVESNLRFTEKNK